jgi:hypothetical protein
MQFRSIRILRHYSLDRVPSPLGRPDSLDLFHQPLGNGSIDLSRLLLSHPMRSINLRLLEVLAQAAHVRGQLRVLRRSAHGVISRVDLIEIVGSAVPLVGVDGRYMCW